MNNTKLEEITISVEVSSDLSPRELCAYIREAITIYGKLNYKIHPSYIALSKIKGVTITYLDKIGYKHHPPSLE